MDASRVITSISVSEKHPGRLAVTVGRRVVASLPEKIVAALNLHVGQTWTEPLAAQVKGARVYATALCRATNRLAHRMMSRARLERKLKDLSFDSLTIERVIEHLTKIGLLDDEQFGRRLIGEWQARKPTGPRLLRARLLQRGIDRALADHLVREAAATGPSQTDGALNLARRKLRSLSRFEPRVRRRRLYGALARRGFDADTINEVMEQLSHELTPEET